MSGVCGWIGGARGATPVDIDAMTRALPRGDGQESTTWRGEGAALGAVFRPLAGGAHRDGTVVAAIEGAPRWADPALEARAARDGHAAALADGWRDKGRGVLDHLRGAFSLSVVEPATGRGLLAVDRYGICTMKFAVLPAGGMAFGSSADAVAAHPGLDAGLSPQALLSYLCFFVVPAPLTIRRGVSKLMAGQYLALEPGAMCEPRYYWKTPYRGEPVEDESALGAELRDRLASAVRRAAGSGEIAATGAFLSGGLDSSSVCGFLAGIADGPVKAFTVGFAEERYDETPFARLVADRFGLDHHVVRLEETDALGFIGTLAAAYDEPFGNSSAIPAYFCARRARELGVRVMLAGDGGDEIFGGNERYLPSRWDDAYRRLPAPLRKGLISPLLRGAAAFGGAGLRARARTRIDYIETPMPDRLVFGSWLLARGADAVFGEALREELDTGAPLAWLREVYGGAGSDDPLQRHMHLDMQLTLADNDLRKVTRMCELAGCEVRFPMLDDELVEFAAAIPGPVLLRDGVLRGFYKRAMDGFLPQAIVGKRKHGFGMPFGEWMRSNAELRQLAHDSLAALARRDILRREFVEEVARSWDEGGSSAFADGGAVWDLVVLELWLARPDPSGRTIA